VWWGTLASARPENVPAGLHGAVGETAAHQRCHQSLVELGERIVIRPAVELEFIQKGTVGFDIALVGLLCPGQIPQRLQPSRHTRY
jgi:hypothetical protein